mgnify:CR=1 FL=1
MLNVGLNEVAAQSDSFGFMHKLGRVNWLRMFPVAEKDSERDKCTRRRSAQRKDRVLMRWCTEDWSGILLSSCIPVPLLLQEHGCNG